MQYYPFQLSILAIAVAGLMNPTHGIAADSDSASEEVEVVDVIGQSTSFTNNMVTEEMKELQTSMTSVLDVVGNLPGVNIEGGDVYNSDDWSTSITLRGFTIDLNEQQIGLTIDGLPNGPTNYGGGAKPNRFLDPENLKTVVVSQGTADIGSPSNDALGGTIAFYMDDPREEEGLRFDVSSGDFNAERRFVRYDSGDVLGDTTTAFISFSDSYNNRWIGSGSNGYTERNHIDFKAITNLDALTVTTRLSYDDSEEDNYNGVTLAQFEDNPDWDRLTWNWTGKPAIDQNFAEAWSTLRENTLLGVKFEYELNDDMQFAVHPYYHYQTGRGDWLPPYQLYGVDAAGVPLSTRPATGGDFTRVFFVDADGNPLAPPAGGDPFDSANYPQGANPVSSYRHTHYMNKRFGSTFDFNWQVADHAIRAGMWLENQERDESRDWHAVLDAEVYHHFDHQNYFTQYDRTYNTDTTKLYLQDTWTFNDLQLVFGVSQFLVDLDRVDHVIGGVTGEVESDSDPLPSIGFVYDLNASTELYGSYVKNFAAIDDRVLERVDSDLSRIEPEESRNIDLGVRVQLDRLNLSFAVYDIEFENRLVFIAPGSDDVSQINYTVGTNGTYDNIGGIDSQGLELAAQYAFTDEWGGYLGYSYNDSEYIGNVDGITAGNKVVGVPENILVVAANYFDGVKRFGVNSKYVGERYGNLSNSDKLDDYLTVDMYVGYTVALDHPQMESFDFKLTVNNLLDEEYLGSVYSAGDPGYYFIGGPRTVVFTASAQF